MKAWIVIRAGWCGLAACALAAAALAATPAEMLKDYTAQARAPASPERGQKFFTTNFGRDMGWSCASCHGVKPTRRGRDEMTEKPIEPLAPAANPKRFTDKFSVERSFRLNCKDVVGRECTAGEKADVLSWLLTLAP